MPRLSFCRPSHTHLPQIFITVVACALRDANVLCSTPTDATRAWKTTEQFEAALLAYEQMQPTDDGFVHAEEALREASGTLSRAVHGNLYTDEILTSKHLDAVDAIFVKHFPNGSVFGCAFDIPNAREMVAAYQAYYEGLCTYFDSVDWSRVGGGYPEKDLPFIQRVAALFPTKLKRLQAVYRDRLHPLPLLTPSFLSMLERQLSGVVYAFAEVSWFCSLSDVR